MADVRYMPVPTPPPDVEFEQLDELAVHWLHHLSVPPEARQLIRRQREAIRVLRINLAKTQAQRDSIKAIAAIERDERVAGEVPPVRPT